MGFIDNLLGRKPETKLSSNPTELLPLQTTMRTRGYLTGIGGQDLYAYLSRRLPGSLKDWTAVTGDLMLNSIVAISMDYYIRAFSQAVPMVFQLSEKDDEYEKLPDHPILALLANPQYGLAPTRFWSNLIIDYKLYGNCYIRKIRSSAKGSVIGLQYLPAQSMQPFGDGTTALTKWRYVNDGIPYDIALDDIIQIAYGRDPLDYRIGRSPLMACLREIATDNQASSTAYGLMKNSGLPSLLVSPDANNDIVDVNDDDLRTMKKRLEDSFTGDNSGSIAVMSSPFKVEKVSFSPSDMALDVIRHTPEERITASLGLNCLVLNLSAGLQNSTYNNLQEAEQSAWNQGVIPLLTVFAESITQSLLPEFPETKDGDFFKFDLHKILALQEDQDALIKRAEVLYKSGIIDRATAKRLIGFETDPTDEMIYHPEGTPTVIPTQPVNPMGDEKKNLKSLPNEKMKEEARRGLAWREEFGRGGTSVGINRAKQISAGETLSEEDVLDMYAFFSRHEVDKQADGFNPNEDGYPSNGRIAWSLWGGDAGFEWSKRERDKIMKDR
jgi:HK97 family phage portal protein